MFVYTVYHAVTTQNRYFYYLPNGASHKRQAAAMAPAEAPDTFFRYKSGAYLQFNPTGDNYTLFKR